MQYRQANPWDAVAMVALWDSGRGERGKKYDYQSYQNDRTFIRPCRSVLSRWERLEERKGFNDGLNKGRADALAHRRFNPVILQRRFVSNDYREGFRKGYAQAYYQFAKNRGHHYGRGY